MKNREEIPTRYTWDLAHLYHNQAEWEKALVLIEELTTKILKNKGQITSQAPTLYETLTTMDQLGKTIEAAGSYARMSFDVNMGNSRTKSNYERMDNIYARIGDKLAFYEPELLNLKQETFEEYKKEIPELATYSFMFEKLFKEREHILSPQEEEILSRMDSLGNTFRKIYDDITVNDLSFPEIEDDNGKMIVAGEVNYRRMLTSYDRGLRERFFKALLETYGTHINSLTSSIYGNLKYRAFLARTRKYFSSRQMSLSQNHIPLEVYDSLIQTVRSNVHLLQKYLQFRKRVLGYEEIHFYDLFVPLVEDISRTFTFEEARDTVLDALSILGPEYSKILKKAFLERWIDVFPNKGKTSGAYANGIYGVHPYALLNFTGTMEDLFTMAHELGHVMHSFFSNKNQPYVDSSYVIFTAEVASTVNEYILYRYLLERAKTKKESAYLLSMHLDSIRSTLYRQAFFADFEIRIHEMTANEEPLTPELLCVTYKKLYEFYHGPDFSIDRELTYEWLRIPHFYSSFYVYQYATGISAAIALAKNIINSESSALDNYLNFLKSGGSDYPINLLKAAGVDMSTPTPVVAALEDFQETLNSLAAVFRN
jgi:oligoendopeptidase F